MKVIDPGHSYELANLDDPDSEVPPVVLYFVKREGPGYPGNVGHHAGTNLQDVLRALIDRVKYLDNQIHDHRNSIVLAHLRSALFELELRAADRHGRVLNVARDGIEDRPVCPGCGHVGCESIH